MWREGEMLCKILFQLFNFMKSWKLLKESLHIISPILFEGGELSETVEKPCFGICKRERLTRGSNQCLWRWDPKNLFVFIFSWKMCVWSFFKRCGWSASCIHISFWWVAMIGKACRWKLKKKFGLILEQFGEYFVLQVWQIVEHRLVRWVLKDFNLHNVHLSKTFLTVADLNENKECMHNRCPRRQPPRWLESIYPALKAKVF